MPGGRGVLYGTPIMRRVSAVTVSSILLFWSACDPKDDHRKDPPEAAAGEGGAEAVTPPAGGAGSPEAPAESNGGAGGATEASGGTAPILATGGSLASGGAAAPTAGVGGGAVASSGGTASGGAATAGAASGGAASGGAAPGACGTTPVGTVGQVLLDDLEDGDAAISPVAQRTGGWYTAVDTYGSTIDAGAPNQVVPSTLQCHSGTYCLNVSGNEVETDNVAMKFPFAIVGFRFVAQKAQQNCPYDLSPHTGISLWLKGTVTARLNVLTKQTVAEANGGICKTNCGDHLGQSLALTAGWTNVTLSFASLTQAGWGTFATFDKTAVLGVELVFPPDADFTASIDDVTLQ